MTPKILLNLLFFVSAYSAGAQTTIHYNLADLLKKDKLQTDTGNHAQVINVPGKQAISLKNIAWLKDVRLKNGTIDVDLRGKDVFLQSFLGIAFHATDTGHYDVIYFRPFRFHSTDTATRRWSVQYMGLPDHDWEKLRKAHPWVYENQVNPVPNANDWFHATIVLQGNWITVFVDHSTTPSLKIQSLNSARDGGVGLWADVLPGDFANLSITR
ncbi:MAG TPA: hypothetical protein VFE53_15495 [Mucilaginibacter sp.]|nr:hypothetical protein [Mucilaginibacter sp.]